MLVESKAHLFDIGRRTRKAVYDPKVSYWQFLNETAFPGYAFSRRLQERWFQRFPMGGRADLRGEFRSGNDTKLPAMQLELVMHELLRAHRFLIKRPESTKAKEKTPDFEIERRDNSTACLVEVTTLNDTEKDVRLDRAGDRLIAQINSFPLPPGFDMRFTLFQAGRNELARRRAGQEVAAWLCAVSARPDQREWTETLDVDGWQFEIHAWRSEATEVTRIGGWTPAPFAGGARHANHLGWISKRVEEKARKYRALGRPLVVAVGANPTQLMAGNHLWHAAETFAYGQMRVFFPRDHDQEALEGFRAEGFFNGKRWRDVAPSVSGVVLIAPIDPLSWKDDKDSVVYVPNPHARHPMPNDLFQFPRLDAVGTELHRRPGLSIRTLLRIPASFPTPRMHAEVAGAKRRARAQRRT